MAVGDSVLRRTAAVAASALIMSSSFWLHASAASADEGASGPIDMATAQQRALSSGSPVVVDSLTSETTLVNALPDGTFSLDSTRQAVRTRDAAGNWVPIDTSLARNADGTYSPTATTEKLRFSGGGTAPLVTIGDAGEQVSYQWDGNLPVPTVTDDSATYSQVLPGVDLKVSAEAGGFHEVLVVRDAAAASNPALSRLTLGVTVEGLALSRTADGGLSAKDVNGDEAMGSSVPVMWDSTRSAQAGETPEFDDPGSGQVDKLGLSLPTIDGRASQASADMVITPPASALTGPDVTYPLFIDPALVKDHLHYDTVMSAGWHYYDDPNEDMRVGYCNWTGCNGIGVGRSFFQFDTSSLTGRPTTAVVHSAQVYTLQTHGAAGCTAEPTNLYSAYPISAATVWPGTPATNLQNGGSAAGDQCGGAANITWSNANVVNYFQGLANADNKTATFGLVAPNESDKYQWKKFGNNPSIHVVYDFPPSNPTGLNIAAKVACTGVATYTRDTTPTVYAQAIDNNPTSQNVKLYYEIYTNPAGSTAVVKNPTAVLAGDNVSTQWTTNSSNTTSTAPLAQTNYALRARASNLSGDLSAGYSPWFFFTEDSIAPSVPTVASFDYPVANWGAPQATAGAFNVSSPGGAAALTYSFDTSGGELLPADTDCTYTNTTKQWVPVTNGIATIRPPTSLTPGPHKLYVKSFDAAHNVSAESAAYSFYVAPTVSGEGPTRLEAEALANDPDLPLYQAPNQNDTTFTQDSTSASDGRQQVMVANGATLSSPHEYGFFFTPQVEGDYSIGVQVTTGNHNATLAFSLATIGTPCTTTSDLSKLVVLDANTPSPGTAYVSLGGAHLTPQPYRLQVCAIGTSATNSVTYDGTYNNTTVTNVADNGMSVVIDSVTAVPVAQATSASLNAAMNNDGIGSDGAVAGDIGPSASHASFSGQALSAVGITPGASFVDRGVTFSIPTANSNGQDNVIADGQTIPLPAAATNTVDLLVASTCGATPADAQYELTMNTAGLNTSDILVPSVPDWLNQSSFTGTAAITQVSGGDHYLVQKASSATPPKLYHLTFTVPVEFASDPVTTVTLPNYRSTFLSDCTKPNLHVFAVTGT